MSDPLETDHVLPGPPRFGRHSNLSWLVSALLVFGLYGLDQATKGWTVAHLPLGSHWEVAPPWFLWVHFSNTGAAFGIMQDSNRFFIGLSMAALAAMGWVLARGVFAGRLNQLALLLLLSGVLGNLTDRLLHRYVVDFLYFDLGFAPFHPWPAFNVADSCICVAVGLMLWESLREELRRTPKPPPPAPPSI